MSLRAPEFEARVWRAARERLSRRPKLLTEFNRYRWGRWMDGIAGTVLVLLLCSPVLGVALMAANANVFVGGVLVGTPAWLALIMIFLAMLITNAWRQKGRELPDWMLAALLPLMDRSVGRGWLIRAASMSLVFVAPLGAYHATALHLSGLPLWSATLWGLAAAVGHPLCLIATVMVFARWLARWFQSLLGMSWLTTWILILAIACALPIQWGPAGLMIETRHWLWWPTGWPWLLFESAAQGDHVRSAILCGLILIYGVVGFVAAHSLLRRCEIREFTQDENASSVPLFREDSIWGGTASSQPATRGRLEEVLTSAGPQMGPDFVQLVVSHQPISVEEARKEVLSGSFLQPWPDEQIGLFERLMLMTFVRRERRLADCLMVDGHYWTQLLIGWWAVLWGSVLVSWLTRWMAQAVPLWLVVALGLISILLGFAAFLLTIAVVFLGWPALIWTNSQNRGLPLSAYLPVSHRELQMLRVRVILLKLFAVVLVALPVAASVAMFGQVAFWPILVVIGKLSAGVLVLQSWWFLTWQPSGPSLFRKAGFYVEAISLLLTTLVLGVFLLIGDENAAWAAPAMVFCGKLASYRLDRVLDRPIFELLGCNLSQQNRSFVLTRRPPK